MSVEGNMTILMSLYHNSTLSGNTYRSDISSDILNRYIENRSVDDLYLALLVFGYVLLAVIGFFGNSLVCAVVIWKPYMRSTRNMLILNLAISDMILCIFTMPFSLVQIVTVLWTLGDTLCKCVAGFQATSVFVSTLTITAIAIDRYKVIVHPTSRGSENLGIFVGIVCIWVISLLLATPLFIYRETKQHYLNITQLPSVTYCSEKWSEDDAVMYSICAIIFQYLFPILAVSITHSLICMKLEYRTVRRRQMTNSRGQKKEEWRRRRTNNLLLAIACVFALTWLPLNIMNLLVDFKMIPSHRQNFSLIFGICHMLGMTSACSNPILYGWFNENFRKEFKNMLKIILSKQSSSEVYEDTFSNGGEVPSETGQKITYLQSEL